MQKFANKQIVYVNGPYSLAEKCEVIDYVEYKSSISQGVYNVHSIDNRVTFMATENCMFATEKDAREAFEKSFADLDLALTTFHVGRNT